jgi:hypothetical protein
MPYLWNMNTTNSTTTNELTEARNEYRAIRNACKAIDARTFDLRAGCEAHELADGEEVTSYTWVTAAHHVAAEVAAEVAKLVNLKNEADRCHGVMATARGRRLEDATNRYFAILRQIEAIHG